MFPRGFWQQRQHLKCVSLLNSIKEANVNWNLLSLWGISSPRAPWRMIVTPLHRCPVARCKALRCVDWDIKRMIRCSGRFSALVLRESHEDFRQTLYMPGCRLCKSTRHIWSFKFLVLRDSSFTITKIKGVIVLMRNASISHNNQWIWNTKSMLIKKINKFRGNIDKFCCCS